ncbi:hypothetical protein [Nocardia barduliensis]|uniref:hypothetical protein n=1 Tax=Nocardia barduliensis TaxID=2736643 RepID=UPI0028AD3154|nr:hypothetical protein [Nocardia barduliensis]
MALLAAVVLVVSMADCSITRGHAHTHMSMASAVEHVALSHADAHAHALTAGALDAHCATHFDHCLAKSVLRAAPENRAPQLLIFALTSAFLAPENHDGSAGGVRGPPISWLPVADGRATLIQFCIARC